LATTRDYVMDTFTSRRRRSATGQQDAMPVGPELFRTEVPNPPPPRQERLEAPSTQVPDSAVAPANRIRVLPGVGSCVHAALGPNDLVGSAGIDGVIRVVATRTARFVAQCALPSHERPQRISWGPWARHLASTHDQGLVVIWDLETEVPNRVLRAAGVRVDSVAFSHDGRWVATAGERRLRVFDSGGVQLRDVPVLPDDTLPGGGPPLGRLNALAFAPGDRHIVVAGDDGVVRQFDVHGSVGRTWRHPSAVVALSVSERGLVTGSAAGRVAFWDWDGGLLQRVDHDGRVEHAALSSDGKLLVTSAQDRTVRVWADDGTALAQSLLGRRPAGVGFLSDGSGFLTVTVAGEIETWAQPTRSLQDDPQTEHPA